MNDKTDFEISVNLNQTLKCCVIYFQNQTSLSLTLLRIHMPAAGWRLKRPSRLPPWPPVPRSLPEKLKIDFLEISFLNLKRLDRGRHCFRSSNSDTRRNLRCNREILIQNFFKYFFWTSAYYLLYVLNVIWMYEKLP